MFETLSQKILGVFKGIRNRGILTPEIIDKTLREIRISLLEADVALPVVRFFISSLKEKLEGQEVIKSTSPEQIISKYLFDEIKTLLGEENSKTLKNGRYLMSGLQGAGKTTASAKLAFRFSKKFNKKVLLVSLDTSRPAAVDQLQKLASNNGLCFFNDLDLTRDSPISIASRAMEVSKDFDITIFDTAGRTYVDESLMKELLEVRDLINPVEKFLVLDSLMGQDALKTASAFNENLELTGLIMTRIDGDNKGGACLSAKFITHCQIRFLCSGEKIEDIEEFYPGRIASRILDNGDVMSLVEKALETSDDFSSFNPEKKFDLNEMEKYFKQLKKIGGIGGFLKFLPGMGRIKDKLKEMKVDDKMLDRQVAIIRSMTFKERADPTILNASRRRRIAAGAGIGVSDVNSLLKQFDGMRTMISRFKKAGGIQHLLK